jgi:thioredoxin reductase (NADPH)
MEGRYDIAIIGSGPAGLSAAINSKIRNKSIIIFGNTEFSRKLIRAPKINNYLGFYDVSGAELKEKFESHINNMGISLTYEKVNAVYAMGEYYSLLVNEKMYEATSVIIATGIEYDKPINGELEFLGKGVGYCATCDAPLYKNKTVSIIAYNKDGEEEADFVSELAGKVYYIPMYEGEYNINSNIEIVKGTTLEISGSEKVEILKLKDREIKTDGVFVLKNSIAPDQLVPGILIEEGHITVDRNMSTNIPGCFAAGDCTGKPYQYIKSAGEGQVAALNAVLYIDSIRNKK